MRLRALEGDKLRPRVVQETQAWGGVGQLGFSRLAEATAEKPLKWSRETVYRFLCYPRPLSSGVRGNNERTLLLQAAGVQFQLTVAPAETVPPRDQYQPRVTRRCVWNGTDSPGKLRSAAAPPQSFRWQPRHGVVWLGLIRRMICEMPAIYLINHGRWAHIWGGEAAFIFVF